MGCLPVDDAKATPQWRNLEPAQFAGRTAVSRYRDDSPDAAATTRVPGRSWVLPLAALTACAAHAAAPAPIDALRTKFPQGIPWHVEFVDAAGKSLGSIDMRITSAPGDSCLGDMGPLGVRVEYLRTHDLSPTLSVTSHGVARFTGDKIKVDLTGGRCDAYLLMSGEMAPNGASSGDVYTFGMRGGHDIATYKATAE